MAMMKKVKDMPDHLLEEAEQICDEIVELIYKKVETGQHDFDAIINGLIWANAICIAPGLNKDRVQENAKICGASLEHAILLQRQKLDSMKNDESV